MSSAIELRRRTEVYVMRPSDYEIAWCPCGNDDPDWSEFWGRLWCPRCHADFVPAHGGVFDGPIPIEAAHLMGMCFATWNIYTGIVTPCSSEYCTFARKAA